MYFVQNRITRPSLIRLRAEFEWWLGGGRPLCPYLIGKLVSRLLPKVKPRDIRLPSCQPEDPFGLLGDMETEFLERALTTNLSKEWMVLWLEWLRWYSVVAMDPCVRLYQLFDYPVVERSWKRSNRDQTLVRFGLMWFAYDWVRQHSKDPLLILTPLRIRNDTDIKLASADSFDGC